MCIRDRLTSSATDWLSTLIFWYFRLLLHLFYLIYDIDFSRSDVFNGIVSCTFDIHLIVVFSWSLVCFGSSINSLMYSDSCYILLFHFPPVAVIALAGILLFLAGVFFCHSNFLSFNFPVFHFPSHHSSVFSSNNNMWKASIIWLVSIFANNVTRIN